MPKRATKKSKVKTRTTSRRKAGNPIDAAPMRLRGNLHLEHRAIAAEVGAAQSKVKESLMRLASLSKDPEHAPVFIAMAQRDESVADFNRKRKEYESVQLKVANKFGIKPDQLSDYTIDSETGVVTFSPPKGG